MSTLDPQLVRTVAAVVAEGSFERAARVLAVTPSAVSQRVRLLEERVGTVLVVRGQPCTATPAGARLCRHAETLALLDQQLRRELPSLGSVGGAGADEARTTVRVAVNADSLATWFVAALADFAADGDVLVDVTVANQDRTGDALRHGRAHAAVTGQARAVQGCRSRRLGALRYVATASPAFVARWFAQGVDATSLARAPSLLFDPDDRLQEGWVRRLLRRDVLLPVHRLPSTQAFVDATLQGLGWALNPLVLVQGHLRQGTLVALAPDRPLDVPLHWQVSTLPLPALDRLTRAVQRAASAALV